MALVNVQHKPVTGTARQFDGTLAALTDILSGRSNANIQVLCTFNAAGSFTSITVSGGAFGSVTAVVGEWVVFPSDTSQAPYSVSATAAAADWQTVP
jgi:hypothetical protein